MKTRAERLAVSALLLPLLSMSAYRSSADAAEPTHKDGETRVPIHFVGGHDTDPRDRGRPVVLVAGALGVTPEVFREAFSHVRPAPAGQEPDPRQVHDNKDALLRALGRYGIDNDRLDAVSNQYRYNRSRGEMWRNTPAAGYATVRNGAVTSVTITNPGAGYSSAPELALPDGTPIRAKVALAFGPDFRKNGSIASVTITHAEVNAPHKAGQPGR